MSYFAVCTLLGKQPANSITNSKTGEQRTIGEPHIRAFLTISIDRNNQFPWFWFPIFSLICNALPIYIYTAVG